LESLKRVREKIKNSQEQLLEAQSQRQLRESFNVKLEPEEVKNTNQSYRQVYYSIFSKQQLDKKEEETIFNDNKNFLLKYFLDLFDFLFDNLLQYKQQFTSQIDLKKMNDFKDLKSNFNLTKELFQESFVSQQFDPKELEIVKNINKSIQGIDNIFSDH
jgi:hypothetical protein